MEFKKYNYYLTDLATLLIEDALEAKEKKENSDFDAGRAFAYYEVLSTIKDQLSVFEIDEKEVGFDKINPDKDLLN